MKIEMKQETLDMILSHHMPTYSEIPNVGLYLEQTAKYINEFLEPVMDTGITGSMISNYVKKKLVANPVKKQYYRDQIAKLIIIAVLKSVISLDKIQVLLDIEPEADIETSYAYFCGEFSAVLQQVFGLDEETGTADDINDQQKLLRSIIVTVAHKIYIDKALNSMVL